LVVATLLVVLAGVGVAVAVALDSGVAVAAGAAVIVGLVALRIMYTEVVETRRRSAADRATQAKSFGEALVKQQSEHTAYVTSLNARLSDKDVTIGELEGTVRLADKRADLAEDKVKRESKRANDAQARLSELLDNVLAIREGAEDEASIEDLPTIIDLMAWEERATDAIVEDLRKEA
jgi:hypothetical protein